MKNKIAFVVLSCDNYSDLWPIFISQFKKNWPNCPYDKYISTNFLSANSKSFTDIKIGKDNSWSDGVIKALNILKDKYEYVFITLEDLMLMEKVNNNRFTRIISEFIKEDGNSLKFIRKPKPTKKFNSFFGEVQSGSLYRPTCVYVLWKIEILLELLIETENAWEFERYGAVRSDKYKGFYVVYKDFFKVSNTVVKGKWVPSELKKLRDMGFNDKIEREILSNNKALFLKIYSIVFSLFTLIIPWQLRRQTIFKIKNLKK